MRNDSVGSRIVAARKAKDLTATALLALLKKKGVQCGNSHLSQVERGKANASPVLLAAIAAELGVTVESLTPPLPGTVPTEAQEIAYGQMMWGLYEFMATLPTKEIREEVLVWVRKMLPVRPYSVRKLGSAIAAVGKLESKLREMECPEDQFRMEFLAEAIAAAALGGLSFRQYQEGLSALLTEYESDPARRTVPKELLPPYPYSIF